MSISPSSSKSLRDDAQAVIAVRVGDAGLLRHVGERAVAVVAVERVAVAGQSARAALHGDALELAGLVLAELRQVVEVEVDVVGDEQIEIAVVVVVDERRAGGPARVADAGLLR